MADDSSWPTLSFDRKSHQLHMDCVYGLLSGTCLIPHQEP